MLVCPHEWLTKVESLFDEKLCVYWSSGVCRTRMQKIQRGSPDKMRGFLGS